MHTILRTPAARVTQGALDGAEEAHRRRQADSGLDVDDFGVLFLAYGVYTCGSWVIANALGSWWGLSIPVLGFSLMGLPFAWLAFVTGRGLWRMNHRRRLRKRIQRLKAAGEIVEIPDHTINQWHQALDKAGIERSHPLAAPAENWPVIERVDQLLKERAELTLTPTAPETAEEKQAREELIGLIDTRLPGILNEHIVGLADQVAFTRKQELDAALMERASDRVLQTERIRGLLDS